MRDYFAGEYGTIALYVEACGIVADCYQWNVS
jgi:hypothetical protein